uniref:Uncharacterized protein n=1 Tax=Micrurus carvalhoi TaxID=3147026 RepID=A0A2H6NJJ9_9SAUR
MTNETVECCKLQFYRFCFYCDFFSFNLNLVMVAVWLCGTRKMTTATKKNQAFGLLHSGSLDDCGLRAMPSRERQTKSMIHPSVKAYRGEKQQSLEACPSKKLY